MTETLNVVDAAFVVMLASGVAVHFELADTSPSGDDSVARAYQFRHDTKDLVGRKVYVMPTDYDLRPLSRAFWQHQRPLFGGSSPGRYGPQRLLPPPTEGGEGGGSTCPVALWLLWPGRPVRLWQVDPTMPHQKSGRAN